MPERELALQHGRGGEVEGDAVVSCVGCGDASAR
jgi:hypothetical protein